ncbi:MAG: Gfo/Idh/MocA family oxidoreductase [Chitinophagaceae bacterium]
MKEVIHFALIGCGRIGKKHAEIIQSLPGAELTAVCDTNQGAVAGISKAIPFYLSIDALLDTEKSIDVVSIATPNGLHVTHALKALHAGKHIVVEKPMGLTKASCAEVVEKASQVNKQVFCVMQNRYSPPSSWIKDLMLSKRLGKIFLVKIDCFWNRDERYYIKGGWKGTTSLDGGTLFTQFSHFVDMMYWLFGDIHDIHANFFDFNHQQTTAFEDAGIIHFRFNNGGAGVFNYSTALWDKNFESTLTVIAENGTVKIGGQYMNEVLYCHIKDYTMPMLAPSQPPNAYSGYTGSAANHGFVFQNVLDVLNGRSTVSTNALEGMKVAEIIENIYKLKNA